MSTSSAVHAMRRPLAISVRTALAQDARDGEKQDFGVQRDRIGPRVNHVESDASPIGDVAAPANLPETGNTWPNPTVMLKIAPIALDFFRNDRPRSDEAHVAPENIEQLGEFVEASLA